MQLQVGGGGGEGFARVSEEAKHFNTRKIQALSALDTSPCKTSPSESGSLRRQAAMHIASARRLQHTAPPLPLCPQVMSQASRPVSARSSARSICPTQCLCCCSASNAATPPSLTRPSSTISTLSSATPNGSTLTLPCSTTSQLRRWVARCPLTRASLA